MARKRLVLDLDETQHKDLMRKARSSELTLSNYVRRELGLPMEQQGRRAERKPKGK